MNNDMAIKIIPNAANYPVGKRADAELHFLTGPMTGLKLVGFAVWESNKSPSGLNVTFPARSYTQAGEKRSYSLLRSTAADMAGTNNLREMIIKAYQTTVQQWTKAVQQTPSLANTAGQPMKHSTPAVAAEEAEAGVLHALTELL